MRLATWLDRNVIALCVLSLVACEVVAVLTAVTT